MAICTIGDRDDVDKVLEKMSCKPYVNFDRAVLVIRTLTAASSVVVHYSYISIDGWNHSPVR